MGQIILEKTRTSLITYSTQYSFDTQWAEQSDLCWKNPRMLT